MSPARKKNINLLQGIRFGESADYQTWVLAMAAVCLLLITGYSAFGVVETRVERQRDREREREYERRIEDVAMPDFASFSDSRSRKTAFFEFLEPFVLEANHEILQEREEIIKIQQYFERNGRLNGSRLKRLNVILENYNMEGVEQADAQLFERLLRRADTIPPSLVLAQAALESGWGTSRFAREGNNLFGMWCYEPGCGMVPRKRPAGRSYEVTAYASPRQSFQAYLKNLNTNSSYEELRLIRQAHRERGMEPSGEDLAAGLTRYSQERWTYVEKVRNMIAYNDLEG